MLSEYIFVYRIDKISPLDTHIPLHMTALHWFRSDLGEERLSELLAKLVAAKDAIETYGISEELFGEDKDVPVIKLERVPELLELHLDLLGLVKSTGGVLDERWVGAERWNPHVTHQPESRLGVGDKVVVNELDLIKKMPDGTRQIISNARFKGHSI